MAALPRPWPSDFVSADINILARGKVARQGPGGKDPIERLSESGRRIIEGAIRPQSVLSLYLKPQARPCQAHARPMPAHASHTESRLLGTESSETS